MIRPFILLTFSLLLFSCLPEENVSLQPARDGFSSPTLLEFNDREREILNRELHADVSIDRFSIDIPDHIGGGRITPTNEDLKHALLGRVLFYDKRLSATGETSCASCHDQKRAFAENVAFSEGINGAITKRNSLALGAVAGFLPQVSGYGETESNKGDFSTKRGRVQFFWDERAPTIAVQSAMTIEDELEMGRDLDELAEELNRSELYQILAMKAFGTTRLKPEMITLALERFLGGMTAMDTRFDDGMNAMFSGGLDDVWTESEQFGHELFIGNCASCHGVNLTEPEEPFANNGLDLVYADKGMGQLRGAAFNGVFKVPFLRNIALTAPYMHDGRFATLREVIDHYSEGVQSHPTLSPKLGSVIHEGGFHFSEKEKQALENFLRTTTDRGMASSERLANPFRN